MTTYYRMNENDFQHKCGEFVQREVLLCMSGIVSTLATSATPDGQLGELCAEASFLYESLDDYEETCIQEGYQIETREDGKFYIYLDKNGERVYGVVCDTKENCFQQACADEHLEPYQREIFEHWAVSDYLADKLREKGERVGELDNLTIWGRTTTGQSISMDSVIREIVRELDK